MIYECEGTGYKDSHCSSSLGGGREKPFEPTPKSSRIDMYNWINDGGRVYVKGSDGSVANLITATTSKGSKYVKTKADTTTADNLLKLPECK
jgi:hypothetical protein